MKKFPVKQAAVIFALSFSAIGWAQQISSPATLTEAAQAAVLKNPEVQARWHAFREASEEIGVARGGFFPRVDVSYGPGREKLTQDGRAGLSYRDDQSSLTLRQMLFDGLFTLSEVRRLGRAKMVRYFELLDAMENISLEAGRAYLDVVRYRQHAALAEDNYLQHQSVFAQLRKRAESGVGKRVDVDQAASRLALADVNLTTAYANLHDVTARYLRIVGNQPAKQLAIPSQPKTALPSSKAEILADALKNNPALRASIENVEAAQYDLEGRRAPFMPRLDFVVQQNRNSNYFDTGWRQDNRVELRMNYNLLNGGSDMARHGQYRERKNIALDQREKACRDMRQTVSIAYNDTLRLSDQLMRIRSQAELVERTRTAYRDQFNIGQRTLLDLLNTQNEYFDARRALVNAEADLALAYLRSYAGTGRLLENLGLKRVEADHTPQADDLTPVDLAQLCPPEAPTETTLNRPELDRKVKDVVENLQPGYIGNSRPSAAVPAPMANAMPAVPAASGAVQSDIVARTAAWGNAWTARDARAYLDFYSANFRPEGGLSREAWAKQRLQRLQNAESIRVDIQNLTVTGVEADKAVANFRQVYSSAAYRDTVDKTLEWRREGGQWRIVGETARKVGEAR